MLASDSVGLGSTPLWIRLVIAGAIYVGYCVSHILGDAKIRNGRAVLAAAIENRATAQLQHLIANPEGNDQDVVEAPPAK